MYCSLEGLAPGMMFTTVQNIYIKDSFILVRLTLGVMHNIYHQRSTAASPELNSKYKSQMFVHLSILS